MSVEEKNGHTENPIQVSVDLPCNDKYKLDISERF